MDKYLHIISFNIPWPANYGGVIDVFHKIRSLHLCGIKIILHCFEYERPQATELERYCHQIYYYKRDTGIVANITLLPYNVYSRKQKELIDNLLKDNHPILFEGLHSCYYFSDNRLKGRTLIFRSCNVEHDYYQSLAKAESNLIYKLFYRIESIRFRFFEKKVRNATHILAVSTTDVDYFKRTYPETKISFMPCFHANDELQILPGKSDFVLYHGKLSVLENEKAALYLIRNLFSRLSAPCIIAGMDPSAALKKEAARYKNIKLIANPSEEEMNMLTTSAQVHALITFQDTGLKLKLLNSLFKGRHVLVNSMMLAGSGLESLCYVADDKNELIEKCNYLLSKKVDSQVIEKRSTLLNPTFSNLHQAKCLINIIYPSE